MLQHIETLIQDQWAQRDNSTIGRVFKQESHQHWKEEEEKRGQITKETKKRAFNLVSVWVKTGRNSQTKGKMNNFCIVDFEEMVVANVLPAMEITLDVTHVERSPLNAVAYWNTDPRSMGTNRQFHNWMSVQTRRIPKLNRGRTKERKNYKRDKKKHSILLVCG